MKKILLFVLLFAFSPLAALAQHDTLPYYVGVPQFYMDHSIYDEINDTVQNSSTYRWGLDILKNIIYIADILAPTYQPNDDFAIRFTPDSTLHVIGVAMVVSPRFIVPNYHYQHFEYDEEMAFLQAILDHTHPEYDSISFRIYQPVDSHMFMIKTVTADTSFDTATARLYMPMIGWPSDIPFGAAELGPSENLPSIMLEVYFENEQDLSDSFYISAKYYLHAMNWRSELTMAWYVLSGSDDFVPLLGCREIRNMPSVDYPWQYGESQCYPLLFPIIRRDCDSCPQVRGLQYIKAGSNKAIFKWQMGENHRDWQLSYGPAGTAPEDGTIVDCSQRMTGNIEFDPDSHYVAYVRARCRFARYEYGPWSDPLTFSLNGGIDGIDEVSVSGITLTPNPAADRVTVAAEGMESVELIGVDGTVLQRKECRGECVLDLTGLASGIYMVRVSTPTGTATKRLAVQ